MKKQVIGACLISMFTSCATFSRTMIKDDLSVITRGNICVLDGTYAFKGYEHTYAGNKKSADSRNFAAMLDLNKSGISDCNKVVIQSSALDKRKAYQINFKLLKNDSVKYVFAYDGKLKNGLLVLNNYTSGCHGIPFLFGGCRSFQSRIGLTAEKNLLVQDYYDNSGALLFVMWAGYTINYTEKFKKIQ